MLFIPALEVTSFLHFGAPNAEQFHVLAYYPKSALEAQRLEGTFFFKRGQRVQAMWRDFALEWLRSLPVDAQRAIDPEQKLEKLSPLLFPALQSMIHLVSVRQPSFSVPFRLHHVRFWDNRELFGWTPEEAIEAIRADGATDIVAHPGTYDDQDSTDRILSFATGFEVYTSHHEADVAARFRARAAATKAYWTASSGDHQDSPYVRPASGTPIVFVQRLLRQAVPMSMILPPTKATA
jgi:hypothetical protein